MIRNVSVILVRNGLSVEISKRVFFHDDFKSYFVSVYLFSCSKLIGDFVINCKNERELNSIFSQYVSEYREEGYQ